MELKEKLDELGRAFEDFKKANDKRLEEVKTFGASAHATDEKVNKMNDVIEKLEKQIEQMNAALARTAAGGADKTKSENEVKRAEYKLALSKFMRKGVAIPSELIEFNKKDMSVGSDEDGGFYVSPETSAEVVKKVFESSPMRQLSSVQSISTDELQIHEDLDEAGSAWVGEIEDQTKTTTPQLKMVKIPVHTLQAKPQASQQLLDDAAVDIEAWLAGKVSEKFSRDEATAFVSGNGVNKPMGVLSYASGTSFNQVERQLTATNAAIIGDDLIDVQSLLKEMYQPGASWQINRTLVKVIRKLKGTGDANYLWQPGLSQGIPPTLLGAPVYYAADLPSSVSATTDTIMYGNFKMGYQIVDRIGLRVLRDPFTAQPFVKFITSKRVGGGVKNFEAIKVLRINT